MSKIIAAPPEPSNDLARAISATEKSGYAVRVSDGIVYLSSGGVAVAQMQEGNFVSQFLNNEKIEAWMRG